MASKKIVKERALRPGEKLKGVSTLKVGKAVKGPRVQVAEMPADGTVVELRAEKKVVPREGDIVEVHSSLLQVHGLHRVLKSDEGILVQSPGSHEVKRLAQDDIETVYRKV